MAAGEWLRPRRGGAHESSGKAWGTWRVPSGNLRLRLASSDAGVQAVRFSYRESLTGQEGSDAGPSPTATVPGPVPALPSWPGSRLMALRAGILALLHHKPFPCFPPTPDFKHRITVQASPGLDRRRNVFEVGAGDSPTFPRFRAIQCKKPLLM